MFTYPIYSPGGIDLTEALVAWYALEDADSSAMLDSSVPADTLHEDTFTGTDGTEITSHAPDTGTGYTELVGSSEPTIQSNAITSTGYSGWVTDVGETNYIITADLHHGASGNNVELLFRMDADDNGVKDCWLLRMLDTITVLYSVGATGSLTERGRLTQDNIDTTRDVYVQIYDYGYLIYVSDELMANSDTTAVPKTGQFVGFRFGGSDGSVDNLKVTENNHPLVATSQCTTGTGKIGNGLGLGYVYAAHAESASYGHPMCYWGRGDGDWSVSLWTYGTNLSSGNGYKTPIACGETATGWYMDIRYGVPTVYFRGASYLSLTTSVTDLINTWYHYVLTYNDTTNVATLYRNGVSVGSLDMSATSNPVQPGYQSHLQLGRWRLSDPRYYNGVVDEVAIYNTVLSQDLIDELYNSGSGVTYS